MPAKTAGSRRPLRVGVDSYSLRPLNLEAFKLMDWVKANGGEGVQFSEINLPPGRKLDNAFLKELSQYAGEKRLYLEWGGGQHIPLDLRTGRPADIFKINRRAAEQARALGLSSVRSCSGGLMRWTDEFPPTGVLLRSMAQGLRAQKRMLGDLGVTLAIETHFEFTSPELLRLFIECEAPPGGYLGICLDTMNLLTMLEDPLGAAKRLLPWVVMTHIKDGGVLLTENGLVTFPVEAGKGIIDLEGIVGLLRNAGRRPHLTLEDHGGKFLVPIFKPSFLLKFPDLSAVGLSRLISMSYETKGYFERSDRPIIERDRWPEVCEMRVTNGLRYLKKIAGREGA
jgi:sugar phosphate isomerase/epimerase